MSAKIAVAMIATFKKDPIILGNVRQFYLVDPEEPIVPNVVVKSGETTKIGIGSDAVSAIKSEISIQINNSALDEGPLFADFLEKMEVLHERIIFIVTNIRRILRRDALFKYEQSNRKTSNKLVSYTLNFSVTIIGGIK